MCACNTTCDKRPGDCMCPTHRHPDICRLLEDIPMRVSAHLSGLQQLPAVRLLLKAWNLQPLRDLGNNGRSSSSSSFDSLGSEPSHNEAQ